MLRKSEKSGENRLPDKWLLRFPLGRWASRSPPFSDAHRSYLIVWHCPCAKLNCTFWCLWGCLKCSADRTPTRSLPGSVKSCPSLSLGTSPTKNCLRSGRFGKYRWIGKEYLITHRSQSLLRSAMVSCLTQSQIANCFSPELFVIFQLTGETENSNLEKLSNGRKKILNPSLFYQGVCITW